MKQKICYLVQTEYHLLLSLGDIYSRYADKDSFDITLIIKRNLRTNRLKQDLDFSSLPFEVKIVDFDVNLDTTLSASEKAILEGLLAMRFDVFIFFQEHDPINIIIIDHYKSKGTKIYLYQDGSKAYLIDGLKFTPSLHLADIKQNKWIKRNGYPVKDRFSFLRCNKYAFLKGIDKLYLSFPEAYKNWNNLPIERLDTIFTEDFKAMVKKVYQWDDSLLGDKDHVIFFMNQPMNDDGSFELSVLKNLSDRYPQSTIYIKLHPLTSQKKIDSYGKFPNMKIISSKIPAELFINELTNSIVMSAFSTSMFINDEKSKFYWIHRIKENNNVERIKKYNIVNPTSHIIEVDRADEIVF